MGKLNYPPEELEPWDVVTTKPRRKHKRVRKPTMRSLIAQARKAGIEPSGATVAIDGSVSLEFTRATAKRADAFTNGDANEWDQVLQ